MDYVRIDEVDYFYSSIILKNYYKILIKKYILQQLEDYFKKLIFKLFYFIYNFGY